MKLGIGARITAVFGLGALILSILMGGLSYFTVRHFLLAGRESTDQHQAFTNANLVRTSLQSGALGGTEAFSIRRARNRSKAARGRKTTRRLRETRSAPRP